jgi:hypothetical protein
MGPGRHEVKVEVEARLVGVKGQGLLVDNFVNPGLRQQHLGSSGAPRRQEMTPNNEIVK